MVSSNYDLTGGIVLSLRQLVIEAKRTNDINLFIEVVKIAKDRDLLSEVLDDDTLTTE